MVYLCFIIIVCTKILLYKVFDFVAGIVVEDCLLLLVNLLKNNSSNQNFFKEGSYIQWLPAYFDIDDHDQQNAQAGWSAQKVTNFNLMLQVVCCFVAGMPAASAHITACTLAISNQFLHFCFC